MRAFVLGVFVLKGEICYRACKYYSSSGAVNGGTASRKILLSYLITSVLGPIWDSVSGGVPQRPYQ